MIECADYNVYYAKKVKKRGKFKRFFTFILIVCVIIAAYFYYKNAICGEITAICADTLSAYSTDAVNESVLNSTKSSLGYDDLITVEKNAAGEITLLSANSVKVNKLSREIVETTSQILKRKLSEGVKIPLLAFTGIGIISAYGGDVYFKTIHLTEVTCDFNSNFSSVGINQTLHSLYIEVDIKITIEIPFNKRQITSKTKVLVGESVLIGKVLELYFKNST